MAGSGAWNLSESFAQEAVPVAICEVNFQSLLAATLPAPPRLSKLYTRTGSDGDE
jgi:hypothetical protein